MTNLKSWFQVFYFSYKCQKNLTGFNKHVNWKGLTRWIFSYIIPISFGLNNLKKLNFYGYNQYVLKLK